MSKNIIVAGGISGALAVILGAFGAHALRDQLTADQLRVFQTGVEYQFYHSITILIAGILAGQLQSKWFRFAAYSFIAGILLFSGSLYIMTLTTVTGLGIITPLGGLLFVAGWLSLAGGAISGRK
jgi:uncharacterized membrane protein YgdD (TMEM256/DUF423 family)